MRASRSLRVLAGALCGSAAFLASGSGCKSRSAGPGAADSPAAASAPSDLAASPDDGRLRPAPGADLDGPVPPPPRAPSGPRGPVKMVDLGDDRPAVKLDLPTPPRAGAASFELDGLRGWVARIPEGNQLPSVAFGGDLIYVSGGFESVSFYALDAKDGHMVWASQALEDNGPTAPIYDEGRVIFNTESCTLFVMDAETGKKLWYKYLGDPTLAQPAVADGLVFAAYPTGTTHHLGAYRVRDGHQVWARDVGQELLGAPVVHGDSVYVTNLNGRVYRLLRKNGKRVWAKNLGATSAPWIEGDRLHLAKRGKNQEIQVVVDAATGKQVAEHRAVAAKYLGDIPTNLNNWKQVWAYEGSRPVVANGVKYEAMGGTVFASDPQTGEELWGRRWAAGEDKRSLGTVALAGPQVVVATRTGEIYGLDADTGYTVWAYATGKQLVAEPIVAEGWVYATTTDGTVVALQVGDSSLDGWHMWGGNPHHDGPVVPPKAKTAMR